MKITFKNGSELNCIEAVEHEEFCLGSNRHVLTVICEQDAISLDALNAILGDTANAKTVSIENMVQEEKVVNGNLVVTEIPVEKPYEGYTMKLKVGVEPALVQPEGPDSAAVYADRLVFKLGRPTFIEQRLAAIGIMPNAMQ